MFSSPFNLFISSAERGLHFQPELSHADEAQEPSKNSPGAIPNERDQCHCFWPYDLKKCTVSYHKNEKMHRKCEWSTARGHQLPSIDSRFIQCFMSIGSLNKALVTYIAGDVVCKFRLTYARGTDPTLYITLRSSIAFTSRSDRSI
jgi:hypothetical protein